MNTDLKELYQTGADDVKVTMNQVCAMLDLSPVYVRRYSVNGTIPSSMEPLPNNPKVMHRVYTLGDIRKWRGEVKPRSKRADGRNRFVLYASAEELAKLKTILEQNESDVIIERNRQPKPAAE